MRERDVIVKRFLDKELWVYRKELEHRDFDKENPAIHVVMSDGDGYIEYDDSCVFVPTIGGTVEVWYTTNRGVMAIGTHKYVIDGKEYSVKPEYRDRIWYNVVNGLDCAVDNAIDRVYEISCDGVRVSNYIIYNELMKLLRADLAMELMADMNTVKKNENER